MAQNKKPTRRRGKQLEEELLTAAWDELQIKGYNQLTMEGIAARAHTTKTVLYRRWPKKPLIIVAAFIAEFKKSGATIAFDVPNTGSLREDLFELLSTPIKFFDFLGEEAVRGVIADQIGGQLGDIFKKADTTDNDMVKRVRTILEQADQRGEIKLDNLSSKATNLPGLLLINEIITSGYLTKAAISEIVDAILVPVFLNSKK